jgi:cytidylate kinase
MPIIIVSSDALESEKEIAEATAGRLGYKVLGRELLHDVAVRVGVANDISEGMLKNIPSPWRRRLNRRWSQFLARLEADVLNRLMADNIVCWGLAAHHYVLGISHVLKVCLVSDLDFQAKKMTAIHGISEQSARKRLEKAKRKREEWSMAAFGRNESDSSRYDLVVNLDQIAPDEAVETITNAAGYRKFQPMTFSIKSLADRALEAEVKSKLLESLTDFRVQARDGKVVVTSKAMKRERRKKTAAIKELAGSVEGVGYVEVHLINYVIRKAAESFR